jgi:hypothetical protein
MDGEVIELSTAQLQILEHLISHKLIVLARNLGTTKKSLNANDIIEAVDELDVYIRILDKVRTNGRVPADEA